MNALFPKIMEVPVIDGWPDDPLPLVAELDAPEPFPMEALPAILGDYGRIMQSCTQAPDALVGNSLLAAASLAVQPHANVVLPHGVSVPTSLNVISLADSGERKSTVDRLALHPHALFEKTKSEERREAINEFNSLDKKDQAKHEVPREAIFLTSDPTVEGLCKLLHAGLPSIGVFSAEGGRFFGGYGMTLEMALRTAAGLSLFWDGAPVDRVRAGDGSSKLFGRRVALHLMAQPKAALTWLSNPVLNDQGLLSRCLVAYPKSTAGTRFFRLERPDETPAAKAYVSRMTELLTSEWPMNEFYELEPHHLGINGAAQSLWIAQHDQIERQLVDELKMVRAFASKSAEHIARIAAVFTLVEDVNAASVSEAAMEQAVIVVKYFLGEALRLSGAQPQHEKAEMAVLLWNWLQQRGKRHISLPELVRYGPTKLRKADTMRHTMDVLAEHYLVRPVPDGTVVFEGKRRQEAWEVRL